MKVKMKNVMMAISLFGLLTVGLVPTANAKFWLENHQYSRLGRWEMCLSPDL